MLSTGRLLLVVTILAIVTSCAKRADDPSMGLGDVRATAGVPERYRDIFDGFFGYRDEDKARAAMPFDSITLERTGCYGTCPAYAVTFFRSGVAELEARAFMPVTGSFEGKIDIRDYARMCYAIERAGFASFKANYRAPWSDDATCIVTVTTTTGKRTVSDYGQVGPIELWLVQSMLDNERQKVKWSTKSDAAAGKPPESGAKAR